MWECSSSSRCDQKAMEMHLKLKEMMKTNYEIFKLALSNVDIQTEWKEESAAAAANI